MVEKRNAYFAKIRERNDSDNLRYSEARIFQDELLHTLTILFEEDFKKYLWKPSARLQSSALQKHRRKKF